jgi:sigma-B regulation protein RsbU (phosphoserine phosphatase)
VVGAVEGISYGESHLTLDPGDAVILYTDGVTEAMNPERDLYSDQALETLIANTKFLSTEAAVAEVFDAVREHRREAEPSDDITVLALSFDAMMEIEGQLLEITVPSEIEAISTIFDEFTRFAEQHSLDDTVRRAALLVLDEFVNNVVSYSHTHTEEHEIKVVLVLSSDRLAVTIEDDGQAFNPFKRDPPDLDASLDDRQIGGLGIHLVKSVMDDYEYRRLGGRNVVTVYKNLDAHPKDNNK